MGDQTSSWPSSFVNASSMAWRGEDPPPRSKDQTQLTLCYASSHSCLALLSRRDLSGKHKDRCLEQGSAALSLGMILQTPCAPTQEKSLGTISDGLEGYIWRRIQGHCHHGQEQTCQH